jgi:hypothetical protein
VFGIILFMVTMPALIFNNELGGAVFGETAQLASFGTIDKFFTIYMTSIGEYDYTGDIPND